MQPRLATSDLACRRGDRLLFRGLTLDLQAGDALHITGQNGIGKSSLLRILAGLARPFAGMVDRTGLVGLVDERDALDPDLPLGRALAFWEAIDRAEAAPHHAQKLGIAGLSDVPVRYLSTGQRKRAALSRLLGQEAAIWLLDEPFNGLDRDAKITLESLVAQHCADGGICVVASHQDFDVPAARSIALEDYAREVAP